MADWKMIDADGHIREVESDVFEYLPDYYKARREAVLYFPLLPHHGWHRQAGRAGIGAAGVVMHVLHGYEHYPVVIWRNTFRNDS